MTPALAALQTCYCLQGTLAGDGTTAFMTQRHLLELSASESRWGQGGSCEWGSPDPFTAPVSLELAASVGERG